MIASPTRVVLDPSFTVGRVDDRLFGSFVEHMGRAVYGGIYEPEHPSADEHGFRADVLALTRELGVTLVRYPGGNFVSGYDWEDGVGPRDQRPSRLDLAWRSVESNAVGTDDFLGWAERAGVETMMAVNLGTRGADAARSLVEYCNAPQGTRDADRRAANGHPDPYDVRLWCLGNEMDGPWQIAHKTAAEYGRLAGEAGRIMRMVDPSLQLAVVGSSHSQMPTFGHWEDTVLDLTWDVADLVSLHTYYDPGDFPTVEDYLSCSLDLERMIGTVVATADAVAGRHRSRKRIGISVDEYNVCHQHGNPLWDDAGRPLEVAPRLAEDVFTVADALALGALLITLLRHADRVHVGCLAQLVNVLGPIRAEPDGDAWRQTTFFPFRDAARYARGTTVLRTEPAGATVATEREGDVPAVDVAAVVADDGAVTVFALNRSAAPVELDLVLRDMAGYAIREHTVLADDALDAANTREDPLRVRPRSFPAPLDGAATTVPARSWNVLRLGPRD